MLMTDEATPRNCILKIFAFTAQPANLTQYYELVKEIFQTLASERVDSLVIDLSGKLVLFFLFIYFNFRFGFGFEFGF
jgi:hypothetical protein